MNNDLFERPCLRLRGLRYLPAPVCRQRYRSGSSVRRAFGHRAQRAHPTVWWLYGGLIEARFRPGFFGAGQPTHHYRACTCGDGWQCRRRSEILPSAITGIPVPSSFNCVGSSGDLRNAHTSHDTSGADGAGPIPTFHRAATGFRQRASAYATVATLPPMICRSGYLARVHGYVATHLPGDREES